MCSQLIINAVNERIGHRQDGRTLWGLSMGRATTTAAAAARQHVVGSRSGPSQRGADPCVALPLPIALCTDERTCGGEGGREMDTGREREGERKRERGRRSRRREGEVAWNSLLNSDSYGEPTEHFIHFIH